MARHRNGAGGGSSVSLTFSSTSGGELPASGPAVSCSLPAGASFAYNPDASGGTAAAGATVFQRRLLHRSYSTPEGWSGEIH